MSCLVYTDDRKRLRLTQKCMINSICVDSKIKSTFEELYARNGTAYKRKLELKKWLVSISLFNG